ncbi:MAG TPA: hypothetical protein VEX13_04280 [Chloroflexia bacterium]|nr:hypothetical protein [Chloroflexia bacterium]
MLRHSGIGLVWPGMEAARSRRYNRIRLVLDAGSDDDALPQRLWKAACPLARQYYPPHFIACAVRK